MGGCCLESLVKRAIQQDETAFWQLYKRTWSGVYYTSLKILGNESDARDATQEVYLRAFRDIKNLREPVAFRSWLGRITTNVCNSMLRKSINKKREVAIDQRADDVAEDRDDFLPDKSAEKNLESQKLIEAINSLSAEQRMAVILHYYQKMSYAEIAESMGISPNGVESRLRRARNKLKDSLLATFKSDSKVSALAAGPMITAALTGEASTKASIVLGKSIEAGAQAAVSTGATTILGGSGATGAAAVPVATKATTAGAGALTKAIIGIVVTASIAGVGAGVVLTNRNAKAAPYKEQVSVATATLSPIASAASGIVTSEMPEPDTPKAVSKAEEEGSEEVETADDAPAKKAEPSSPKPKKKATTKPINSIADMIGATDANKLAAYRSNPPASRGATLSGILSRHGFRNAGQQNDPEATYRLYVLEKQDKRLRIIERIPVAGGELRYGISYVFESKSKSIPEPWELMFEF